MMDPMQFAQMLQRIQENPQLLDQAATMLAGQPQMQPPPPGGMQAMMKGLMEMEQQGAPNMAQGLSVQGTQVANQAPNQPMPAMDLAAALAPSVPSKPTPEEEMVKRARAMAALQGAEPQRVPDPPYIGNLNFGAATPSQGLQMPVYGPVGQIRALGDYL